MREGIMNPKTKLFSAVVTAGILWIGHGQSSYVWPDEKTDRMEGFLFDGDTFFKAFFPNCTNDPGQNIAAEWLRTAYHDMATADVVAGTGGLDASLCWEADRDENAGNAINNTFHAAAPFQTRQTSMSDMLALMARFAVGYCSNGTVVIPFRAGRVDADGPGPKGVPKPEEDIESHTRSFARQGFNVSEMIALVACGHTMGGVHNTDFPEIAPRRNNEVSSPKTSEALRSNLI
jgi:hypothetical protein